MAEELLGTSRAHALELGGGSNPAPIRFSTLAFDLGAR